MLLFIPLIPILITGVVAAAGAAAVWYGGLSPEEREREDRALAKRLPRGRNGNRLD